MIEKLLDEEMIYSRVCEIGRQISADYRNRDLLLLCILKGSVIFLADLMRQITIPYEIDFMAVDSYGKGVRESTGTVRIAKDLSEPITGRHVLIIEDIVDAGHTLFYIIRSLHLRRPASLKICALLDKPDRRKVEVYADYVGFTIPDKFVFGYGLDLDGKHRGLPFVGVEV